ncbi:hypothetical protein NC796_12635 [Aliifodinibius sp. S!AR15-10]|uniref:hypothetical protein n=1 Tax=Aliifodinibius sp. S!AR15-10 TaxID=2950437 RepID=UPI0028652FC6|nr:hypothetical protein [Aliifodinibius sp. S!AR15-10]MDR8391996.1 hypothetical protein [Aliifodinibius sp. S!AR15-10]
MKRYKIIFDSGVTEEIEVGSLSYNDHIGRIEINDDDGEEMEEYYLDFEQITAIIPLD